jgi:hypothetical protein
MMSPFATYQMLVDNLREARRDPEHKYESERADLALLTDLYELLTATERDAVEQEGWRSWPDLYDKRHLR